MKKLSRYFIIIVIILAITISIPIIINKALYLPIKTNTTNDSDWLAFWGSFLGGIFGGFATLIGVLYTIKKNDKDKEKEEKKKLPFVVPLQKNLLVYRDVRNEQCYLSNEGKDENQFEYELIYFDLINLASEHAFNISLTWNAPKLQEINKFLNENKIKNIFNKEFRIISESNKEERRNHIQIIKSSESEDIKSTYIFVGWRSLINNIVESMARQNNGFKNSKIYKNMPLGKLTLKYKTIHGKDIDKKYLILADIFQGYLDGNVESYYLTFNFELDEDN